MKGSFIFLADGFEETEALATLDVLRRGGIEALLVSIDEEGMVTGSHGVTGQRNHPPYGPQPRSPRANR